MRRDSYLFAYAIVILCFTISAVCGGQSVRYGAGNSKRSTPDYSMLEQNRPVVSSGQGGSKNAQKSKVNLNRATLARARESTKSGRGNLCERQLVIAGVSKDEANRIAYRGMKAFSDACEIKRELAVLCNENGKVLQHKWGDVYRVEGGMPLDNSALLHIHNHPFDEYSDWPSYADIKNAILIQLLVDEYIEQMGCKDKGAHERKVYHYIVVCSWENKPSKLIRYDENGGVFRVKHDGSEEGLSVPGFVNDASFHWGSKENRPFRSPGDLEMVWKDAKAEKEKQQRTAKAFASSAVGSLKCWCKMKSDSQSCSCKDPAPNITLPPFAPGWARCDKCNKFIGVVTMDKNGDVYVSGGNRVANEMVKDMVKKVRGKGKK